MVVSASGTFVGTKVNPAVRIIHLYEQTKWRVQLQAMLNEMIEKGQDAHNGNRIYFLDNLRTFMIFFVVLYHAGGVPDFLRLYL